MPFEHAKNYEPYLVERLIDFLVKERPSTSLPDAEYILRLEAQLERAAQLAQAIRQPMFRSIRQVPFERKEDGAIERALVKVDFAEVEKRVAPDRVPPVGPGPNDYVVVPEVELVKHVRVTDVAKAGRVLRRWNKLKGCFEFLPRR